MIGWLVAITLGAGVVTARPSQVGAEPSAAAVEQTLQRLDLAGFLGETADRRVHEAGIDAAVLGRWLKVIFGRCLADSSACQETWRPDWSSHSVAEAVLALEGRLGDATSFPLLGQLEARGVFEASTALNAILARQMEETLHACAPPTHDEVRTAEEGLDDFAVMGWFHGHLTARALTADERDDLAYFLVAADATKGPPAIDDPGDWEHPGPPNAQRQALLVQERSAGARGDRQKQAQLARAYLQTLGYPGPIRAKDEHDYSFNGPAWVWVMGDLARTDELTGEYEEAARLYQRKPMGSSQCGTGYAFDQKALFQARVRAWELAGRCREGVALRMALARDLDGGGVYGTDRLKRAGFDLERLFRGALLTLNRDAPASQVRKAITDANLPNGTKMLARLESHGAEDWDARIRALEGWAALYGRRSFPRLLEIARDGWEPNRERAVAALGQLGDLDEAAACDPFGCDARNGTGHFDGSDWRVSLTSLGATCASALTDGERSSLVESLLSLLRDPSWRVRLVTVKALGSAGTANVAAAVRKLETDHGTDGQQCSGGSPSDCSPYYPVRLAVKDALRDIENRERVQRVRTVCEAVTAPMRALSLTTRSTDPALRGTPVAGLLEPTRRDETFRALIRAGRVRAGARLPVEGPPDALRVTSALVAPTSEGAPRVVVFYGGDEDASWAEERMPTGAFAVLDAEGAFVPIFQNANEVDLGDVVFNYAGARIATTLSFPYEIREGATLDVVSILPLDSPEAPLLTVVIGRAYDDVKHRTTNRWTWRVVPDGPGHPPRIEIGTDSALMKGTPAAVYRWSEERHAYLGPDGRAGSGFLRVPAAELSHLFAYLKGRY